MSFSDWESIKINDVCRIRRGASPRPIQDYIRDKGIPWVKISDATVSNSRFINSTNEFIKEEGKEKSRFIKQGTLILSNSATPGIPKFMGIDACVHDGWLIVDEFKNITDEFLYYTFINERVKLLNLSNGSVFRNLKTDIVKNYGIKLPPMSEQKAIARILSTLDEKIEVNNQINKTLENMAQAIFKQWFVDFEFPNEDGEPYKSSGGEMVESELGMIPKGWEVKKSSDIANINIGKTPPRKEKECFTLDPDDYKWISIKDLGNSGAYIFDSSEYLTKESIEKYNVKVVPDNTVVLSFKLTVGRVSITCGQMTTNEAIAHFNLSNKSKITTEYLYLYLKSFDYGKLGNTSSIANAVNSKIIKAMPIIVPDNKTIKTFSEVMESVFSKIKYTIKQSDKLIEIRDTLLPKLMSGEIRVPMDEEGDLS